MKELTQQQRDMLQMGLCPYCEAAIRGFKAPLGPFAPEAFATLREMGIDPSNGHKRECQHKEVSIK